MVDLFVMPETVQQYTARILGLVAEQDPFAVQKATVKALPALVKGMSAARLRRAPAPGRWSVSQIVAHLADAEVVHAYRLRMILSRNRTEIQAYDQNLWAETGQYADVRLADALELFLTLRRANLRLVGRLTSAQRLRYGVHQERGRESIHRLEQMYAGHDLNHLAQIRGILGA